MKRVGASLRALLVVTAALASSGCASLSWPDWFSDVEFPEWPAFDEYTESPKSYVEIALEHDFLVRVKPWERGVLSRRDMMRSPDPRSARTARHVLGPGRARGGAPQPHVLQQGSHHARR